MAAYYKNNEQNIMMIGQLAEDYIIGSNDKTITPILINKSNYLQFTIVPLSDFPIYDELDDDEIKYVSAYASDVGDWHKDDLMTSNEERIESLRGFLSDKLIIFTPQVRKTDDGHYLVAKNIELKMKNDKFISNTEYEVLPIFREDIQYSRTQEDFEARLFQNKAVGSAHHVRQKENEYPLAIIWEESSAEFYVYGGKDFISSQIYNQNVARYDVDLNKIQKFKLNDEWDRYQYTSENQDILFIPSDRLYPENLDSLEEIDISETVNLFIDEQDMTIASNSVESEVIIEKNNNLNNKENVESSINELQSKELAFINRFKMITQKEKLLYSNQDLINFHTAMKSGNLVILAGLSGSGKSKLVSCYAKALNSKPTLKMIPVQPFWQDDSDLLGFVDINNFIYHPGDSGLVDTLIEANSNTDKMYVINFDEMNLARVEHYFAQFLSVMEMDPIDRRINLYSEKESSRLFNSDKYPPFITISTNVIFTGTVNLDESTFTFSDKVLDRANVIKLDILPFSSYYSERNSESEISEEVIIQNVFSLSEREYRSFRNNDSKFSLSEDETELIWKIHEAMYDINSNMGVGWRILRQIDMYLKNLPNNEELSREDALDIQLVQRILTKVRGSKDQLEVIVGEYENKTIKNSYFFELFEEYSSISHFNKSREAVTKKAKELSMNGYTF
ncbi:McrB family protein [uncultured Vagococcus sp.]|uniref:McrB family protein n=1 Tax=uncultured Vagococcus sp. TaxID=189676 RepID=UPI00258AA2F7|nr:hypothetical protein [uncultured Vagococcus sp.]